jgi:pimeloyl-ACP methyl ester carboxylesterase/DNA-binding winged helix-turn-helix (wHTH) protein
MVDPVFSFGEFRLDAVSGHLYRGAGPVPLTPKGFAVLQHLVSHAGRLISKAELIETVWPSVFVGDAVLKSSIREVRRALGDDPQQPRYIETAHRRGYRWIAPVVAGAPPGAAPCLSPSVARPRVSYATSGQVNIAYEVIGSGPIDLVFVMGWVSHLEYFWTEPSFALFLERLSRMARLILFDKRGTGLSDRVSITELPTLEQRMDDVRAVMEAAGSRRAVLLGVSEGGPLCTLFAATHPARTEALVMIGSYARRMRADDYPWGATQEERDAFCRTILEEWGGPVGLEERAPSRAHDPVFREWWASYLRMGASPGAAVALTRMNAEIDVRGVLSTIRVPTLVLHRTGDRCLRVEEGRFLAEHIPGAAFVEQPGEDHLPFVGDQDAVLAAVEDFLARTHQPRESARTLATILVLRAEEGRGDSRVEAIVEREVVRWRGQALVAADRQRRWRAIFDGPGRAVQCAGAIVDAAREVSPTLRAGVHIGEVDLQDPTGPVLDVATAFADTADPLEIRVSQTVVDLVPGSGLRFDARGTLAASRPQRMFPVFALVGEPADQITR